jgi:SAM-dependent methyltransferase
VLDLAAGTGKLTRTIIAAGANVTAVEPLDGMRAQLQAAYPDVPVHAGTAEQIPLDDDSVDAVLVGQAFHWFDHDAALDEIARVLRPGGVLGLLWNIRDDSIGWVAELTGTLVMGADVLSQVDGSDWESLGEHERFGPIERRDFPNPTPFDADRLVAWATSTSTLATMAPDQRAERLQIAGALSLPRVPSKYHNSMARVLQVCGNRAGACVNSVALKTAPAWRGCG